MFIVNHYFCFNNIIDFSVVVVLLHLILGFRIPGPLFFSLKDKIYKAAFGVGGGEYNDVLRGLLKLTYLVLHAVINESTCRFHPEKFLAPVSPNTACLPHSHSVYLPELSCFQSLSLFAVFWLILLVPGYLQLCLQLSWVFLLLIFKFRWPRSIFSLKLCIFAGEKPDLVS